MKSISGCFGETNERLFRYCIRPGLDACEAV
jgi:hypothetical protein